ncbi:s-phase kinase-associated protein 1 [Xylaria palmicola]|nr:s-phase kinase-associated protein 1 [Xylaria palmicola]
MSTNPMVTLISGDDIEVHASLKAVRQSVVISIMLDILEGEKTSNIPIPVPELNGETLHKIMEWCEHYRAEQVPASIQEAKTITDTLTALPEFDANFFDVDRLTLFTIANAANYLEIPLLSEYSIFVISKKLEGMTTQEMREYLNLPNDFTPEQEQAIRDENAWANADANP